MGVREFGSSRYSDVTVALGQTQRDTVKGGLHFGSRAGGERLREQGAGESATTQVALGTRDSESEASRSHERNTKKNTKMPAGDHDGRAQVFVVQPLTLAGAA